MSIYSFSYYLFNCLFLLIYHYNDDDMIIIIHCYNYSIILRCYIINYFHGGNLNGCFNDYGKCVDLVVRMVNDY